MCNRIYAVFHVFWSRQSDISAVSGCGSGQQYDTGYGWNVTDGGGITCSCGDICGKA